MPKFRKKPVEVEATQWLKPGDHPAVYPSSISSYGVIGKQGTVDVHPGDWIIAEMDGSGFYPCKPDVFAATYDPA